MGSLLALFSQGLEDPLAFINENDFDDTTIALSTDNFSTNIPANYLINSLATQPNNHTTSLTTQTQTPLQTQAIPTTQPNTPNFFVNAQFPAEFRDEKNMQQLRDLLENQRSLIFRTQFEQIYSKIDCSFLTQHMWSHCQCINLIKKEDLFACYQAQLKRSRFCIRRALQS